MKNKCEKCKSSHDGTYGSGRFCSNTCARSFSTSNDKTYTKIINCFVCESPTEVNKRTSKIICDNCKTHGVRGKKYHKSIRICNQCGQTKCPRKDVCQKHQIYPTLVKYFGFDNTKKGSLEIISEYDKVINLLNEDYHITEMSIPDMVEKYNHYDYRNFNKILNSLEIIKRSRKQGKHLAMKNKIPVMKNNYITNYNYKHGWHTTWNNKLVFYRSSYELEYANKLDDAKINYQMESLRIEYWDNNLNRYRIAIPDFYLPESNLIVEIKSDFTLDIENMREKVNEYTKQGYAFKLILEKKEVDINTLCP